MFETVPMDKIGVTNERQTNLEYLGTDMIEGGNEFGVGTPYGKFRGRGFRCSRFGQRCHVCPVEMGRGVGISTYVSGIFKDLKEPKKLAYFRKSHCPNFTS